MFRCRKGPAILRLESSAIETVTPCAPNYELCDPTTLEIKLDLLQTLQIRQHFDVFKCFLLRMFLPSF